ncbi:hypothetical protein [Malonomonas rubra]|uniref:hypothetical protein n=1 Tax=Malonomonas rubra TaxID=57040 RepID=UPI0026ECE52D|nr:hypothetical protein [Malonomonas rubra]
MTAKVLSAGDYIASKCTKCKDTTGHTIVAMVGGKVIKVECNTCGSIHNYRDASSKKVAAAKKTSSTGSSKPRTTKAERAWEELQQNLRPEEAIPYNMNTPMREEMLIRHPTFGLGLVLNCIRPNKMEVHFQSGIKLLRCKID